MTIIFAKVSGTVGVLAGAGGAVLAAIEPSTQVAIIGVVSLFITSVTGIGMAWIAYKQNVLNKKTEDLAVVVGEVKKQTDGITSKLVDATGRANLAEGELKGRADSQVRQDAIDLGAATIPAPLTKPSEPAMLKKIEKNTAETAESAAQTADNTAKTEASTARTEATVQDLNSKS